MQTVRSWKLSDFATPRGFGDCRWAGTVWNENKGRGLGRELGNGRLGTGLNAQTPRGSAPRHLADGSACDLTWAQASLPSAPRPAVTKVTERADLARPFRARGPWSATPRTVGCVSPGPLAQAGATTRRRGSYIEEMLLSLVL